MNKVNKQKVLCVCEKCLVKSNGIGMYVHSSTKYRHENIENLYKDNENGSSSEFPDHRVYVNDDYEFYSFSIKHQLSNDEVKKLKECYSAIYDMNIKNINVSFVLFFN